MTWRFSAGLQPAGRFGGRYLGLRPRLVERGPLAREGGAGLHDISGAGARIFVGEDFAGLGDVLFDGFDLGGPVASGFIGVGNAGGVLTLGLG